MHLCYQNYIVCFCVVEYNNDNPINPVWVVWVLVAVDSPPCPDAVGSAPLPPPRPPPPPASLERSLLKATHSARETPLHQIVFFYAIASPAHIL